jgi:hypothetical protein
VVHAGEHGGAGPEAVDQIDLPQRAVVIQRRRREVGDQLTQGVAIVRRGQRDPVHVIGRVEQGVVFPVCPAEGAARAGDLTEAREVGDDPLGVRLAQPVPVGDLVEPQQRVDDHQVGRAVHPQPGGIRM